MWLLTCDGDLFGGKSLWLRPGSSHLFGRTTGKSENGEHIRYIEHKTVSRKHLLITILPAAEGSSTKLHARSKVEFKESSKIGTVVDDRKIVQTTQVLEGVKHTFKLGNYEFAFHLKWQPVVLCSSSASKTNNVFAKQRATLEAADIKLMKEYVSNATTHSISKRRNTPSNLQALVQGRWLVTDEYVSALLGAVKPSSGGEPRPLELDFHGKWPSEQPYLPPPGTEPVKRPNDMYFPREGRDEIFADHVFLFLTQSQYDNLLSVITSGGGKALLWEVELGESKVEELVEYIKEVAGRKDAGQFRLTQQTGPGGIVVVRPSEKDDAMNNFIDSTEMAIGQTLIEQNELLDVILTQDTSSLRRPRQRPAQASSPAAPQDATPAPAQRPQRQSQRATTVNESPTVPEVQPQQPRQSAEAAQQDEQPAPTVRKRQRRYITQSRFKGFDDDFDPSQFSKPATQPAAAQDFSREASQAPSMQDMDVDHPSQAPVQQCNSRKRPAEPAAEPDEEAFYAELLPGQAAMKRQKQENAARNGGHDAQPAKSQTATPAQAKKKKAKELDVMAELQKRREKQDEEHRKNQESLQAAMEGVNLSSFRAKVEEMEMPVRDRTARGSGMKGHSNRWDPTWNGRKNFKKFRPQGSSQTGPRLQRVIVTLEEVPRRGQGIGDEYWLQSSRTSKSKSQSQSQSTCGGARSQRTVQAGSAQGGGSGEGEEQDFSHFRLRQRLEHSREQDAETARAEAVYADEIAGTARDDALNLAAAVQSTPTQTLRAESQRKATTASGVGKRAAATQSGGPPAKRARRAAREVEQLVGGGGEDEGDDDELKFRRRRR